jgi:hypothetical protein
MAFARFRFFRQQVAFKSFIPAYFTCACNFESFFSTAMSLHLWHGLKNFGMAKVAFFTNQTKNDETLLKSFIRQVV